MRIGIVAYWFNRGQAVVARQMRSALDDLGHETFVLARPTRKTNIRPDWIDREGVWAQEGVTAASGYLVPWEEYEAWTASTGVDLVMFDQNYQFDEIARLRRTGVRTVGRFVWEHFSDEHVGPAGEAFDRIYSLTAIERERYAGMGVESPRVRWGCHPDLVGFGEHGAWSAERGADSGLSLQAPTSELVTFLFPGGFMSKRKPLEETIAAFRAARGGELRLVIKAQVERQGKLVDRWIRGGSRFGRRDARIELLTEDMSTDDYLRLLGSADVCLAPSRWEGLGLHLFEATALGVPILTNDNAPMNEVVVDEMNGLLVEGVPDGSAPRSGIPAFTPDVPSLTAAIERIADPRLRGELAAGARRRREELSWETTKADLAELVEHV